ncbi:MAG: GyrI-like domain-containing protein, partial [Clostridium sp.]|nr:GyrI-like domain-containing protein [Clostridium sp.]
MSALDYKKTQKELYSPTAMPSIIEVPEMVFIMIDGYGDPNTGAEYKTAVEILYGLSYSIKMSKKSGDRPDGYF